MLSNIGFLFFQMVFVVVMTLIIVWLVSKFKGKTFLWKCCLLGAIIGFLLSKCISYVIDLVQNWF